MELGDLDHLVGDLGDLGIREHLEASILHRLDLGKTHSGQSEPIQFDERERRVVGQHPVQGGFIDVGAPNHHISCFGHETVPSLHFPNQVRPGE